MILLFAVVTLAVHVRLGLGRWPTPIYESYRTSASILHMSILERTSVFAIYCAGPLWLVCLLIPMFQPSRRSIVSQVAVAGVGWLLIVGFLTLDPTTFSAWLLD